MARRKQKAAAALALRPPPEDWQSWILAATAALARHVFSAATRDWPPILLLAGVAGPKLWTYPARLTEFRRTHCAQDGYYNYYAANFHPAEVVAYLEQTIPKGQSYLVCFSDADHFALGHYFQRAGLPFSRAQDGSAPVIYTITPPLADYERLAAKFDLPAGVLRSFPLVRDFGYYRLHCSGGRPPG